MYTRRYNGSVIKVRRPTEEEIGNGYYDGNEWVYTVKNSRFFTEGSVHSKAFAIKLAKMATER